MNPLRRGRRLVTICIVAGLFGLTREASQAQTQAAIDLTGLWAADNGTILCPPDWQYCLVGWVRSRPL